MRWWGVVPIERLHHHHGPLGSHPRMCMGHRARHLWGQAKQIAILATLWKASIKVLCARTIVLATFRRSSAHLFERPLGRFGSNLEQFGSHDFPFFFSRQSSSLWTPNGLSTALVIT